MRSMKFKYILVLNGPNLNLLGKREPELYGTQTLAELNEHLADFAAKQAQGAQISVSFFQSNAEHLLIEAIHQAMGKIDFIIFNPAAFTHTSIALRDALLAVKIPFMEVHLSDIQAREPFRRHSYFSDIAVQVISGQGILGYELALRAAIEYVCGTSK